MQLAVMHEGLMQDNAALVTELDSLKADPKGFIAWRQRDEALFALDRAIRVLKVLVGIDEHWPLQPCISANAEHFYSSDYPVIGSLASDDWDWLVGILSLKPEIGRGDADSSFSNPPSLPVDVQA